MLTWLPLNKQPQTTMSREAFVCRSVFNGRKFASGNLPNSLLLGVHSWPSLDQQNRGLDPKINQGVAADNVLFIETECFTGNGTVVQHFATGCVALQHKLSCRASLQAFDLASPGEPAAHVYTNCSLIQIVIICAYGVIM